MCTTLGERERKCAQTHTLERIEWAFHTFYIQWHWKRKLKIKQTNKIKKEKSYSFSITHIHFGFNEFSCAIRNFPHQFIQKYYYIFFHCLTTYIHRHIHYLHTTVIILMSWKWRRNQTKPTIKMLYATTTTKKQHKLSQLTSCVMWNLFK